MPLKNSATRWGSVSIGLHWLVVALILLMAWIGLRMGGMPNGPAKIATYALHKSVGISILALAVLRLAWRAVTGAPGHVAGTPAWQARIATLAHVALYALLLAIPLSGWLLNSAAGFPLQWFGVVNLPALAGKDHALHELAEEAHELLFWALVLLALVHAAAAMYHHLFLRDDTLSRMLPRGWLRTLDKETHDA